MSIQLRVDRRQYDYTSQSTNRFSLTRRSESEDCTQENEIMMHRFVVFMSLLTWLPLNNSIHANDPSRQELDPEQISSIFDFVLEQLNSRSVARARVPAVLQSDWHLDLAKALDPTRHYFLEEDLTYFKELEIRIPRGTMDFEFAKAVQKRLVQRVASVEVIADRWLTEPHDFTLNEFMDLEYEGFAADSDDLSERWRKRIKLELLGEKLSGVLNETSPQGIGRRYRVTFERHRLRNNEDLVSHYIDVLLKRIEPHATYMGPDEMTDYNVSKIRGYSIGLRMEDVNGEKQIIGVRSSVEEFVGPETTSQVIGMRLVAVRTETAEVLFCENNERYSVRSLNGLRPDHRELGDAQWVTLELRDPYSRRRLDVQWPRRRDL